MREEKECELQADWTGEPKASGEGCEWGFFKWSEDRMGERNDAGFRLLVWVAHCGLIWRM